MNEKPETTVEEIARLRREIAERQFRLQYLILGDQTKGVGMIVDEEWPSHGRVVR